MTLCVGAPRANKMTVEVDVITDDAVDSAIGRAVEHRIEAVSSHGSAKVRLTAAPSDCPNLHRPSDGGPFFAANGAAGAYNSRGPLRSG